MWRVPVRLRTTAEAANLSGRELLFAGERAGAAVDEDERHISATQDQLAGDYAPLAALHSSLRRSCDAIARAKQACETSLAWLDQLRWFDENGDR
jgi:hypothetical protein